MNRHFSIILIAVLCVIGLLVYILSSREEIVPKTPQQSVKSEQQKVRLGIDHIDQYLELFLGKKVGLITNHTGINSQYQSTIDVLNQKTKLVALFSPEHGIRGNVPAGDYVNSYTDNRTGITVYSLYGKNRKPSGDMLNNVDIIAFDIQDVGARFYTYIYTMAYAMESAKQHGKTFVVFDRPNPIGGQIVEGNILNPEYSSFVGMYPIPLRHGLTVGEMAKLFNEEFKIGCNLIVIPMSGWKREMYYDQTGLPWVAPSPNMPSLDTATVYSGTGILGGTNISEGLGTTKPFELVGAPWLDAEQLAERMNRLGLPGVYFRPAYFTPRFGRYQGIMCNGVQIHVLDRNKFRAVRTAMSLLYVIKELGGSNFQFNPISGKNLAPMIDLYIGDSYVRQGTYSLEDLLRKWEVEALQFKEIAKKYYLYQ